MKTVTRWVAPMVVLAIVLSSTVRAQVLQQVPSDALVVLKINNLKAFSDKVGKMAQDLGLVGFVPQLGDPLGGAQGMLQLQQGLNVNGEMAIAYFDPAMTGGDPSKAMQILIPVTDYKAFLGNSPQVTTEGEVSQVQFAQPMFAANWGQYAVLSPSKELALHKPTTALKAPSVTSKELASKDIVLFANFAALRVKILPTLQQSRVAITAELEQGMAAAPIGPKFAPIIKVIAREMFDLAEGFINDTQAASIGMNITPDGLSVSEVAEFKPGGYTATNIASMKNTDASLLGGLPQGKYLFYGGAMIDSQKTLKVLSDLVDPIVKELLAVGPEMAPVQDYVDAMKQRLIATQGQTFGLLSPSGQLGTESIIQLIAIQKGDTKAMEAADAKMMGAQEKLMKSLDLPGAGGMKMTQVPNAKTVDGVVFNSMTTTMDPNAQDPMVKQQLEVMKMMYGPDGPVVYSGSVGDKMLVVMGIKDDAIHTAISSIKSNAAPMDSDESIKEVLTHLPKQRMGVVFINLGEIATTALNYMKQFGFAVPVQLPPGLPPIAASLSTEDGTAVRVDVYVPKALLQSMIAAGMQAAMNMGAGGGPGGGGARGGGL